MTRHPGTGMTAATNLIREGTPGSRKASATAWEDGRLWPGDDAAAPLRQDRDALMAEYRRLAGEGRIEFVTFHQSFSYEDFVERLRPTTDSEREGHDAEARASGRFRRQQHAGVLTIISSRDRLDPLGVPIKRPGRSEAITKVPPWRP